MAEGTDSPVTALSSDTKKPVLNGNANARANVVDGDERPVKQGLLLPTVLCAAMLGALFLLDAVLPLGGFWFHTSLLPQLGSWTLFPEHVLFPGWVVTTTIANPATNAPPSAVLGLAQLPFLFAALLALFLLYLLALRLLPARSIGPRFLMFTTILLGVCYLLTPVVTSNDLYSYMAYARMFVLYHLNPLATIPIAVLHDPVVVHVYWTKQPSAYGPVWVLLSSMLQWLVLPFGSQQLLPMLLALRGFGLAMHVGSSMLIWSIAGRLQRQQGAISHQRRVLATLAFAWNPLLLFEACVNAHNDAALVFLVLLAFWLLVRFGEQKPTSIFPYIAAIATLALATCLKANVILLIPLLLMFAWKRSQAQKAANAASMLWKRGAWGGNVTCLRPLAIYALVYVGLFVLLYAPFWQNGAILNVLHTNPTSFRNTNTPAEFLTHIVNSIIIGLGLGKSADIGSPAEAIMHYLSIALFALLYAALCWRWLRRDAATVRLPDLLRVCAVAWLLYCILGTPWFWPWYAVTFFGLYALVQATSDSRQPLLVFSLEMPPLAIALLSFSLLSIYCFYAWPLDATYIAGFKLAFFRGLWVWGLPLLAFLARTADRLSYRRQGATCRRPAMPIS